MVMADAAFIPPAPAPRVVPANARPSLQGYLRYFKIMTSNPLEIFTDQNYREPIQTGRLFGRDYAMVHDPDAIRHYLVANADNYGLTFVRRALFEPVIGKGLLIAEGDLWRRTRKALTPVFTLRRVRAFAPTMHEVALRRADRLAERARGGVVDISEDMLTLALDVLIACLFSGASELDAARFSRNLDRLLRVAGTPHPLDLLAAPKWAPRWGRGEAMGLVADLRAQVAAVLRARRQQAQRARPDANFDANADPGADPVEETEDFLSLLMNAGREEGRPLTDEEIIDNLLTFLAAGHETTARTLAWTLFILSRDPRAMARIRDELASASLEPEGAADWADALPYLEAALKESMRLYPAAAMLTRLARGPDEICGRAIKAGTEIVTATWVLHRHRALWDEPDAFRPERFLGAAAEKIARTAYLPFGAGPRVCIGASFSMQEMMIVLAILLRRFDFAFVGDADPEPVMRITIQPTGPIPMRVTAR